MRIQQAIIVGAGNVATHVAMALTQSGLSISQVCAVHENHARELAAKVKAEVITDVVNLYSGADLYIIAVPDDKISFVVSNMPPVNGVVCHTSGITPMSVLEKFSKYGVFYPLQTFSKKRAVAMRDVPFCLEASSGEVYADLEELAKQISCFVYAVDSLQRSRLHLAAVLVNNFANHLFAEAEEFLDKYGIDREILFPLIRETVAKLENLSGTEAQTGPARRGDMHTIQQHLDMLNEEPSLKEIYQVFTKQILKKYHE